MIEFDVQLTVEDRLVATKRLSMEEMAALSVVELDPVGTEETVLNTASRIAIQVAPVPVEPADQAPVP